MNGEDIQEVVADRVGTLPSFEYKVIQRMMPDTLFNNLNV